MKIKQIWAKLRIFTAMLLRKGSSSLFLVRFGRLFKSFQSIFVVMWTKNLVHLIHLETYLPVVMLSFLTHCCQDAPAVTFLAYVASEVRSDSDSDTDLCTLLCPVGVRSLRHRAFFPTFCRSQTAVIKKLGRCSAAGTEHQVASLKMNGKTVFSAMRPIRSVIFRDFSGEQRRRVRA